MKEVRWIGDSRAVVRAFPKGAKLKVGQELTRVQLGADPKHGKALPQVGRGVQEVRVSDNKEAYRVVLHTFHKKSKQGIATARADVELARRRYRMFVGEEHG